MAQKVITYYGPGLGGNHLETTYIDTDSTVDTEWTNIGNTGQFTDGTLVQYARRFDTPIIETIGGIDIFRSGVVSATYGAAPSAVDQVVDKTTTVDLANGTTNNWSVGDFNVVNVSGLTGAATITGIAGGADGVRLVIINNNAQNITLSHQSGSSTAANRIISPSGADLTMSGVGSFVLEYIGNLERWFVISHEAAGSGTGDVVGPASATDNAAARYNGTTGKLVQDGVVLIGDTGIVTGVLDLSASGEVKADTLAILDSNDSHKLVIRTTSDLTADRNFTLVPGDAARTLTMTGDATISGTNTGDQTLKQHIGGPIKVPQNTTNYVPLQGTGVPDSLSSVNVDPTDTAQGEEEWATQFSVAGTLKNFRFRAGFPNGPAGGQTYTFTVHKNGSAGAITVVMNSGSETASDLVNTVAVAAGDLLALKIVTSATSGECNGVISFEFDPS